jgi:hypothetical protein
VRALSGFHFGIENPVSMISSGSILWVANERNSTISEINENSGKLIRVVDDLSNE